MINPSRDQFRSLARDHTVIPLWRELLADLTTPVAAYARLVGEGTGFLLESNTARPAGVAGRSSAATRWRP